jgi:CBS domain-containing protein
MTIGRIIASRDQDVVQCAPQTSVREAARMLATRRIGAMPVVDGGEVVGIFSERDLLYCVARDGEAVLGMEVREVMTAPPITVGPATTALEALSLMTKRRIRHLPVIEEGRFIAFVSIGDIVKYRIDSAEGEAEAMRDYIRTA